MMASNDGAIKGLALDMFFEEWDQLETLEEITLAEILDLFLA